MIRKITQEEIDYLNSTIKDKSSVKYPWTIGSAPWSYSACVEFKNGLRISMHKCEDAYACYKFFFDLGNHWDESIEYYISKSDDKNEIVGRLKEAYEDAYSTFVKEFEEDVNAFNFAKKLLEDIQNEH